MDLIREIRYHSRNSLFRLCALLKNPFDIAFPFHKTGEQRKFTLEKKFHARDERTLHHVSAPEDIFHQHGHLMSPPSSPNTLDKGFMKEMDIFLFCVDSLFHGDLSQGIHDNPDVDLVRAAGATRLAVNAKPDGAAFQNLLLLPHLDHPDDAVRPEFHIRGCGATCRALEALVAEVEVFPAPFRNFL